MEMNVNEYAMTLNDFLKALKAWAHAGAGASLKEELEAAKAALDKADAAYAAYLAANQDE